MKLDEKTKVDLKINNVWSILFTIITLTITVMGFYFGLVAKIEKLDAKIDTTNQTLTYMAKTQDEYLQRNKEVQIRQGTLEVEVAKLQTLVNRIIR